MESLGYFIAFCIFYFLPTCIAKRGHRGSVFVINLFAGWSVIGWVLALWLAVRSNETGKAGA